MAASSPSASSIWLAGHSNEGSSWARILEEIICTFESEAPPSRLNTTILRPIKTMLSIYGNKNMCINIWQEFHFPHLFCVALMRRHLCSRHQSGSSRKEQDGAPTGLWGAAVQGSLVRSGGLRHKYRIGPPQSYSEGQEWKHKCQGSFPHSPLRQTLHTFLFLSVSSTS